MNDDKCFQCGGSGVTDSGGCEPNGTPINVPCGMCYGTGKWSNWMCCGTSDEQHEPNGTCPDCGQETYDGEAVYGCGYSKKLCKTCGFALCDGSC
jgi:hypothetical protein